MAKRWEIFDFAVAISALALTAAGCDSGPKLVKAGGVVKYKGAPIPGADVVLVPDGDGQTALGRTDEQGHFTLATGGRAARWPARTRSPSPPPAPNARSPPPRRSPCRANRSRPIVRIWCRSNTTIPCRAS